MKIKEIMEATPQGTIPPRPANVSSWQTNPDTGVRTRTNSDGSTEISDASGITKYNAQGQKISNVSPRIAGLQRTTTFNPISGKETGTTDNYKGNFNGANVDQTTKNGQQTAIKVGAGGFQVSATGPKGQEKPNQLSYQAGKNKLTLPIGQK